MISTPDLIDGIKLNDNCKKILLYVDRESKPVLRIHLCHAFHMHYVNWLMSATFLKHDVDTDAITIDERQLEIDYFSGQFDCSDLVKKINGSDLRQKNRFTLRKILNHGNSVKLCDLKSLKINRDQAIDLYQKGYMKSVGYYKVSQSEQDAIYAVNFAKIKSTSIAPQDNLRETEETREEEIMNTSAMVNCLYENLKAVQIKPRDSEKKYTYKTFYDFEIGDKCIVDSPNFGYTVVEVVGLDSLDLESNIKYKWVIQKIDDTEYLEANRREELAIKAIHKMVMEKNRENAMSKLTETLGGANEILQLSNELNEAFPAAYAHESEKSHKCPNCTTCGRRLVIKPSGDYVCGYGKCTYHMKNISKYVFASTSDEIDSETKKCTSCDHFLRIKSVDNKLVFRCANQKCDQFGIEVDTRPEYDTVVGSTMQEAVESEKCPVCNKALGTDIGVGGKLTCVTHTCPKYLKT